MKARIAALAVGLAADCDKPESDAQKLVRDNLPNANVLPFAGFLTHDLKWIAGFSGGKNEAAFVAILDAVDKSPLLEASPAGKKKLAGLVEKAGKAAEKGEWKAVLAACHEGSDVSGRCEERTQLDALVGKAREWATGRFAAALKIAQEGGDLVESRKVLNEVKKHFSGEPESADAETGLKALAKLSTVRTAEEGGTAPAGYREKAAADFKDTRWAAAFEKKAPAPPEEPPPAPPK